MMQKSADRNLEAIVPKIVLFTTTDVIPKQDSFLSQPDINPERIVETFYDRIILPRKYVNTMDKFTAKMMYLKALEKFKRHSKIGFRKMRVVFPQEIKLKDLPDVFFNPTNYDVLLLDFELIYGLLKSEGRIKEAHYFKLVREAKLEKLVLNRKILEIYYEK